MFVLKAQVHTKQFLIHDPESILNQKTTNIAPPRDFGKCTDSSFEITPLFSSWMTSSC
jgi:hypothetical protein